MPSLSQILKSKIGSNGKSKAYVASQLGVSEKTVENYMNGKRSPKPARLVKLGEIVGFSLSDLSNNVEQNVPLKTENGDSHKSPAIPEGATESDYLKAILALTESNKGLQETNQTVTNTNRVIADTNALLAQRLVNNQPTAAGDRETFDETVATVIALKESLIEISAGIKKVSKVDATKDFHNKVRAAMNRIGNKGSHVVAGKQST